MTETRTLQFESPRALQSLYANDIKLLKNLEHSLGVKVTTREGWVKLEGDANRIDKAQQVFQQLEQARQQGVDIQKHEFNYALKAVTEERDETLSDIVSIKIVTSSRKPPVVYTSGRTLNNALVILDEAQNTASEQMFMLLTRIGLNSKCVVTGDVTQIDLPANKRSGVLEALQALKNVSGIATVYFTERDVVRHELVRAIIGAYQAHRTPAPEARK